jgi:glyoxylase-like metal-dependent hydrolase (beta-lactamase superfamily II)
MPFSKMMAVYYPLGAPPIGEDFTISAPYLGFLLQSDGQNILVDSGISEKFIVNGKAWGGLLAEGGKIYLEKALAKEGVSPDKIKCVIFTHLHNDHAANSQLFSQADFIFQKDEWLNLLDPLPIQNVRRDYDPDLINELKLARCLKIEGDIEFTEGINIYKTPGHTRGSQSIAVNTKKGVVVLVGDTLPSNISAFPYLTEIIDMEGGKHSISPAPAVYGRALPSAITYDFYAFYDSVYKIMSVASKPEPGFIIPGHETSLMITGI